MHIFTAVKFNLSTLLVGMFLAVLVGYLVGFFLRKLIINTRLRKLKPGRKISLRKRSRKFKID